MGPANQPGQSRGAPNDMSVRQIIVLGVALLAAVAALFLVRGMAVRAPDKKAETVTVVTNGVPVLVAAKAMEQGDSATPGDLAWANFPPEGLSPNYIKQETTPKAMEDFTGAIARFKLEEGEPITAAKLIKPGDQGFMAALVTPGFRAIAVPISEESAAAGFILPNDRVDVIVTRRVQINSGESTREEVRSDIVLEDVRVLAIDDKYKPPVDQKNPTPMAGGVATLELTPRDAEVLAMADKVGDVALALRGVRNEAGEVVSANSKRERTGGMVKVHKFGSVSESAVASAGAP